MIKTEFIGLCNANAENKKKERKAKAYSDGLKRKHRVATIKGCMGIVLFLVAAGIVGGQEMEIHASETVVMETEQKYIVRYGVTENYGSTIKTEDGNEWTLIDAPEYADGTEVRVLFDSKETLSETDDEIIDVTER